MKGRLHTRYAPVRRSLNPKTYTPRLACVKPAASVHPEPGSNSSSYIVCFNLLKLIIIRISLYRFFSISRLSYSLFFVLKSLSKRLSIQYVYERVFLILFRFSFVSQSGCKTTTSFLISKNFLKIF